MAKTDKYLDPYNASDIIEELKSLPTMGAIKSLIDNTFPTWFVTTMDKYCTDYPHLNKNWRTICQMGNVKSTQVMIVDDFEFNDSHSLAIIFCECFTRAGFSVRRKQEFIPCNNCGSAVPTQLMWNLFKEKGKIKIPDVWSPNCSCC